jgi:hypothetical protein
MTDDWLEKALRQGETHIDDDGFSDSVMCKLPQVAQSSAMRTHWIVLVGAAVGSAVVAAKFPFAPFVELLVGSAQVPMIGAAAMLAGMAGALLAEPLRRMF